MAHEREEAEKKESLCIVPVVRATLFGNLGDHPVFENVIVDLRNWLPVGPPWNCRMPSDGGRI
jgi:hypothetical protein